MCAAFILLGEYTTDWPRLDILPAAFFMVTPGIWGLKNMQVMYKENSSRCITLALANHLETTEITHANLKTHRYKPCPPVKQKRPAVWRESQYSRNVLIRQGRDALGKRLRMFMTHVCSITYTRIWQERVTHSTGCTHHKNRQLLTSLCSQVWCMH